MVNPISGVHKSKQHIIDYVTNRIDKSRFDCSVETTQYAGHATVIAASCVSRGVDAVVAIGGDGTVNEVGRALVHSNTALGIIPCGSGNGLARHLQIPVDARQAVEVINQYHTECIDYGMIDGTLFFCTCGIGFDAFVSMKFADAGKRGLKTYLENTLRDILKYQPETYEIETEDGVQCHKAFLITCGNAAQYGNNAYIAPHASLTDGLLDITILEPFTVFDVPSLAVQLFSRTIDQNSRIRTLRARRVCITRSQSGVVHYDGDPMMAGQKVLVEIVPRGLNVICG